MVLDGELVRLLATGCGLLAAGLWLHKESLHSRAASPDLAPRSQKPEARSQKPEAGSQKLPTYRLPKALRSTVLTGAPSNHHVED